MMQVSEANRSAGLPAARGARRGERTSLCLAVMAIAFVSANCLLNSPASFSQRQEEDTSLLRPVVWALGLGGAFPTTRGVEIRTLIFAVGAALMSLLAAARLAAGPVDWQTRGEDALDWRSKLTVPHVWWFLLIVCSVLASVFSHAPEVSRGPAIVRLIGFAWWWPLAVMIVPRHLSLLVRGLGAALAALAGLGLWYFRSRVLPADPGARLQYPIGNELWMGACLLPGAFLAMACAPWGSTATRVRRMGGWLLAVGGAGVVLWALYCTRSRSAAAGLAAGLCVVLLLVLAGRARQIGMIVVLLAASGVALFVHQLRVGGQMGARAHSLRARLNYEWPYAIGLAMRKPVGGHGEGGFTMLAGRYAREDQLDDPNVLSFYERSWPGHVHNEYLELAADVGLVGLLGFAGALCVTLWQALRYCDRHRGDRAARTARWRVLTLAGGLSAVMIEEFSGVALREPGLPPVFLTVWAMLWAALRAESGDSDQLVERRRPSPLAMRVAAVPIGIAAAGLGWLGVQGWRGSLVEHRAAASLETADFDRALASADFAASWSLDAFRHLYDQLLGAQAGIARLRERVRQDVDPPTSETLALGFDIRRRIDRLQSAAPRFLGVSRAASELHALMASVHRRRGESALAAQAREDYLRSLEQCRLDEPFEIEWVQRLWRERSDAGAAPRFYWLRCLLRAGEMEPGVRPLFRSLGVMDDFGPLLLGLEQVARQAADDPPGRWSDKLGPETLRLVALDAYLRGEFVAAVRAADQAAKLYERAGPALFAGHSAALRESVLYDLAADPRSPFTESLAKLARAEALCTGTGEASQPLNGPRGWTRLCVLLAAEQTAAAASQAETLARNERRTAESAMSSAYCDLASPVVGDPARALEARAWAERAATLSPDSAAPHGLLGIAFLQAHDAPAAVAALERYIERVEDQAQAKRFLAELEQKHPDPAVWIGLRSRHGELFGASGGENRR